MTAGHDLEYWIKKIEDLDIEKTDKIAIYGTGDGAGIFFQALEMLGKDRQVQCFVENDDKDLQNSIFQDKPVCYLKDIYKEITVLIIAAINFHKVIENRVDEFRKKHQDFEGKVFNIYAYSSNIEIREYVAYIEKGIKKEKEKTFVDIAESDFVRKPSDTKIITWYLPQYHQIEVNNIFHGRGFTEWTNTSQMLPIFTGHYQPHIPYDVGYYDLNNIETFIRQAELAKKYGIYGFCFHYYWFSGKRIMEKPIELFVKHPEIDIHFCINWANENWTALWDGGNNQLMYEQSLSDSDYIKFADDFEPLVRDERYIKIEGKPLVIIYRPNVWSKEQIVYFLNELRKEMKRRVGSDIYIMLTNARGFDADVKEWGGDALVEFPPHGINVFTESFRPKSYINPNFVGEIRNVANFISERKYMVKHNSEVYFRAALTSWDNSARKATTNATVYFGFTPETYRQWLEDIIRESKRIHKGDKDIVFVNSWNEWAEGSHLEPDLKYGYAFLQATRDVLEESRLQNSR